MIKFYEVTLGDLIGNETAENTWSVFKTEWGEDKYSFYEDDIGTYFFTFIIDYVLPKYDQSIFLTSTSDENKKKEASNKLYHWYLLHAEQLYAVKTWYEENKDELLKNSVGSTVTSKVANVAQDGNSYVDEYPNNVSKTETEQEKNDKLSFLNSLAKKYHSYLKEFVDLFVKDNRLLYNI